MPADWLYDLLGGPVAEYDTPLEDLLPRPTVRQPYQGPMAERPTRLQPSPAELRALGGIKSLPQALRPTVRLATPGIQAGLKASLKGLLPRLAGGTAGLLNPLLWLSEHDPEIGEVSHPQTGAEPVYPIDKFGTIVETPTTYSAQMMEPIPFSEPELRSPEERKDIFLAAARELYGLPHAAGR